MPIQVMLSVYQIPPGFPQALLQDLQSSNEPVPRGPLGASGNTYKFLQAFEVVRALC